MPKYLIVRAEHNVSITRSIFLGVFLFFGIRIVQIAVYGLVIHRRRRGLRWLWERRVLGARSKGGG